MGIIWYIQAHGVYMYSVNSKTQGLHLRYKIVVATP